MGNGWSRGRIGLGTDERSVDGRFLHFLDAANMGGHSGAPVFLWATPEREQGILALSPCIFALYGVVSNILEYAK